MRGAKLVAACRACRLIRASAKCERIARDKLTPDLALLSRWVNARERCGVEIVIKINPPPPPLPILVNDLNIFRET